MKKNQAFTLIELVIVASIIVIVATIWYISMSKTSIKQDNTKRISDIIQISSAIKIEIANWKDILTLIDEDAAFTHSSLSVWGESLWVINYRTWTIHKKNYQATDPTKKVQYPIWTTTKWGWMYQVSAKISKEGLNQSYVVWNYEPRTRWEKNTTYSIIDAAKKQIKINWNYSNFKKWDRVTLDSWWAVFANIESIDLIWNKITLDIDPSWNSYFDIAENEWKSLISWINSLSWERWCDLIDQSLSCFPY